MEKTPKTVRTTYTDAEYRQLIGELVRVVVREEIRALLNDEAGHVAATDSDGFINMEQAAEFIKMKKSTLYVMVHKKTVPFHKSGKRTLFKKSELEAWINTYNGQ